MDKSSITVFVGWALMLLTPTLAALNCYGAIRIPTWLVFVPWMLIALAVIVFVVVLMFFTDWGK
jgi:hypothetical protein